MQFKQQESSGPAVLDAKVPAATPTKQSSTLPFGRDVALASISGPTYITAQLLVQQIAYLLSDKIFSYSPPTFDLDNAVKSWAAAEENNIRGETTTIVPLQTRTGAGAFALGYMFSPDFDIRKRKVPLSLLAPTLSLRNLRGALDQLSLLYGVASPFVAHVPAVEYDAAHGLVAEYDAALRLAEDLGLGLVSSSSAYESQHMALFATLMAALLPTLHVYDGVRLARESLRVVDALSQNGVAEIYNTVVSEAAGLNKRLDSAGKVVELLRLFNDELGTAYELFEYHGHEAPETVLVVFGSVESQLAKYVVSRLAADGVKVGAINVRVYRPFVEEAFLNALPYSVKNIAVLGQVRNEAAVNDVSVQSALFSDVLTAVSFSGRWSKDPAVQDVKFAASEALTPQTIADVFGKFVNKNAEPKAFPFLIQAQQYTFWDIDSSVSVSSPTVIGNLLSRESTSNVYVNETYDNLVQGGVVRTDIRSSKKSIEAPYAVEEADVVVVADEKLLKEVDVLKSVKVGGKLLVKLPNFKEEEVEKRLSPSVRKDIQEKGIALFILDSSYSPAFEKDASTARLLVEFSFLKVARPDISPADIARVALIEDFPPTLAECVDAINQCLISFEVPASWADIPTDIIVPQLPATIKTTSFVPFENEDPEPESQLADWQAAAKGLVFKEVYGTQTNLRPEIAVKTSTVTVKENRRLTPDNYDRNIFHIEFDIGTSGLTYKIGEALGIHADNDEAQVKEFIAFYELDPEGLVQVPSREDVAVLETRTVYQSLVQNVDILGKPPKRFYEALAEFATDETEKAKLESLGGKEGADDFKKRSEIDTVTYFDILQEFPSARPAFNDLVRIVSPMKRREYSIASAQAVTPTSVALMIVVVNWVDTKGRTRYGQATRYLSQLLPGTPVTVSVKPSVMKLPTSPTAPLIMAGLGTGLAPFRAFVQYRAMQKAQGIEIGSILLYLGSRHQREEYLYGEEWEAYLDAGVITLLGAAFSRDQPQKIYIQDRMRQTIRDVVKAYVHEEGSFYLCGPTWPVPDVTDVLMEAIAYEAKTSGRKVDPRKEIEKLKEEGRYVLEVY